MRRWHSNSSFSCAQTNICLCRKNESEEVWDSIPNREILRWIKHIHQACQLRSAAQTACREHPNQPSRDILPVILDCLPPNRPTRPNRGPIAPGYPETDLDLSASPQGNTRLDERRQ